jgi:hypothetical protein
VERNEPGSGGNEQVCASGYAFVDDEDVEGDSTTASVAVVSTERGVRWLHGGR